MDRSIDLAVWHIHNAILLVFKIIDYGPCLFMWVAWEMAITCISTVEYHNIRCIFSVFMFCHGFEIIFASSGFLMFLHWIRIYSTRNLSESLIYSSFGKLSLNLPCFKEPSLFFDCVFYWKPLKLSERHVGNVQQQAGWFDMFML